MRIPDTALSIGLLTHSVRRVYVPTPGPLEGLSEPFFHSWIALAAAGEPRLLQQEPPGGVRGPAFVKSRRVFRRAVQPVTGFAAEWTKWRILSCAREYTSRPLSAVQIILMGRPKRRIVA